MRAEVAVEAVVPEPRAADAEMASEEVEANLATAVVWAGMGSAVAV